MSVLERLEVVVDVDGRKYTAGLHGIQRETAAFGTKLDRDSALAGKRLSDNLGKYARLGGMAMAAGLALGGTAILGVATASVKAAASFESQMSRLKAVSNATGKEFESLRGLALQLGKDTVFSAGEAARALTELAKAGVSVADIMGGGAAGTLALASAGELEVARAAEIAANAMNMFGLEGKDVMSVADALAAAANASSLEVDDLANSFKFIGPVANSLGISFQQVIALIAELGNQGIKGEQAGTGLRTMMLALAAPSKVAAEAMDTYGVAVYDAAGKIKPVPALLDHLKERLTGLTQEEQMGLLEKIFGREGASAALILIDQGSTKLAEMQTIVSKAGEATRVAATKMDNMQGSLEQLKGSAETLAISLGTPLINALRPVLDTLTLATNETTTFWDGLQKLPEWQGADFTDKIKIGWESLTEKFEKWFDSNPVPISIIPKMSGMDSGLGGTEYKVDVTTAFSSLTGQQEMYVWARKIGLAVGEAISGLLHLGEDGGTSVWYKAGETLVDGIYDGLKTKIPWLEGVAKFGGGVADTLNELSGQPVSNPDRLPDPSRSFWDQFWGQNPITAVDKVLSGPEAQQTLKEAGGQGGESYRDGMRPSIFEAVEDIGKTLGTVDGKTPGTKAGTLFGDGWIQGANTKLRAWLPPDLGGITDGWLNGGKAAGSKAAGDMDPNWLAKMMGIGGALGAGSGVDGLTSHASSVYDRLRLLFPSLIPMGGYASSGHVTGSYHYTGQAFDVGGSASYMQGMANWLTANQGRLGVREVIYNRRYWGPGGGWVGYSGDNPHTDHVHVSTYAAGGLVKGGPIGPTGGVYVEAHPGEVIISEELTTALTALVALLTTAVGADTNVKEEDRGKEIRDRLLGAFDERSSAIDSYIDRENARIDMLRATGATEDAIAKALGDSAAFYEKAIAEKAAQLALAKEQGLDPATINALASELFGLQGAAAGVQDELWGMMTAGMEATDVAEALALALDKDSQALSDLQRLLDLASESSSGLAEAMGLTARVSSSMLSLINTAVSDAAAVGVGSDAGQGFAREALSGISAYYSFQEGLLSQALDKSLEDIRSAQNAWEDAWSSRRDAVSASFDQSIENQQDYLSRRQEYWSEEIAGLQKRYDAEIDLLTKEQQALQESRTEADAEAELRKIVAKGSYTQADVERKHALEREIQRRKENQAIQDKIDALTKERDAAITAAQDQSEAEQKSGQAYLDSLQSRRDATLKSLERERTSKLQAFAQMEADAQASYQRQKDALVAYLAEFMKALMDWMTGVSKLPPAELKIDVSSGTVTAAGSGSGVGTGTSTGGNTGSGATTSGTTQTGDTSPRWVVGDYSFKTEEEANNFASSEQGQKYGKPVEHKALFTALDGSTWPTAESRDNWDSIGGPRWEENLKADWDKAHPDGSAYPGKLYYMATGGLVMQPTLAYLAERGPEIVIPTDLTKLLMTAAAQPGGGGGTRAGTTDTLHIILDSNTPDVRPLLPTITDQVEQAILRRYQRSQITFGRR